MRPEGGVTTADLDLYLGPSWDRTSSRQQGDEDGGPAAQATCRAVAGIVNRLGGMPLAIRLAVEHRDQAAG